MPKSSRQSAALKAQPEVSAKPLTKSQAWEEEEAPKPKAQPENDLTALEDDFEVEAQEVPTDLAASPSTPPPEKEEPRPKDREIEESGGDSMLARYFREMATHAVMGQEEELATAIEVENAEIAQWVALFSHVAAAPYILESLEKNLPTGEEALNLPQVAELHRLLKLAKKSRGKFSKDAEKKWLRTCESLARAIRLADSDRLWVADAEHVARTLCEVPDPDADLPEREEREEIEEAPPSEEGAEAIAPPDSDIQIARHVEPVLPMTDRKSVV